MKKFFIPPIISAVLLAAVIVIAILHQPALLPKDIKKQVNFVVFYPTGSQAVIEKSSFKYDSSLKLLSFDTNFAGKQITFAEQGTPDSFVDDSNFYPKFIDSLNGYATFSSIQGQVDLTVPKEFNNQTGVMNAKGTLLFAKSSGNISEDNWKQLFNSFNYIKPN